MVDIKLPSKLLYYRNKNSHLSLSMFYVSIFNHSYNPFMKYLNYTFVLFLLFLFEKCSERYKWVGLLWICVSFDVKYSVVVTDVLVSTYVQVNTPVNIRSTPCSMLNKYIPQHFIPKKCVRFDLSKGLFGWRYHNTWNEKAICIIPWNPFGAKNLIVIQYWKPSH